MALGRRPCALSCASLRGGCRVTTLSSTDRGCATVVSGFVTKRPTHASRQHALWLHLPTTLLSITLETTLTTSLAHSLRSPLRALAPDRKGVHFFSDRVSLIAIQVWSKEPTKKKQRSYRLPAKAKSIIPEELDMSFRIREQQYSRPG